MGETERQAKRGRLLGNLLLTLTALITVYIRL